jgi:hypothetical protein
MFMTPKKILSLPVYGSGTTLGLIAAILLLPGGLILAFALGCYWLADRLSDDEDDEALCRNCKYDDACLSPSDGWCDRWEEGDEY